MMQVKLKHLLVLMLCLCSYSGWSNPIDLERARRYALKSGLLVDVGQSKIEKHRKSKSVSQPSLQLAYTLCDEADKSATPLLYVFTPESQKGYIIISGDDAVTPVLGYSTQSKFVGTEMPPQFKAVLEMMGQGIAEAAIKQTAEVNDAPSPILNRTEIKPLLKDIQWGQGAPFNSKTPFVDGRNAPTGCVATALSQIMYYHRHPKKAEGSAFYKFMNFFKQGESLELGQKGEYRWDRMHPVYGNEYYTEDEADAVGLLLFEVGAACSMQYSADISNSSGANALKALHKNFNYPMAQLIRRMNKTAEEWENIIYSELAAQRPVYLDGVATEFGHAFVCDGYDGKGFYHINWGWDGHANGYFNFSLLSPRTLGIGASGKGAYVLDLQAIVGITPLGKDYTPQVSSTILAKTLTKSADYNNSFPKFDIRGVRLEGYEDADVQFSLGIRSADGEIVNVGEPVGWNIAKDYTYNKIGVSLKPNLVPSGSFKLFPIFSFKELAQWQEVSVGRYFNNEITVSNTNGNFTAEETKSEIKLSTELDKTYLFAGTKNTLTFNVKNDGKTAYSSFVSVYFSKEKPSVNGVVDKASVKEQTISIHLEPGESQEYMTEYVVPDDFTECYVSLTYDTTNGLSEEDTIIPNTIQSVYHLQVKKAWEYKGDFSIDFDTSSYSIEKNSPLNVIINVENKAEDGSYGSFSYLQLFVMSADKSSVKHRYNEFEVLLENGQKKAINAGGELYIDEGRYMLVVTKNSHEGDRVNYSIIAETPLTILPKRLDDNIITNIETVSADKTDMLPVVVQGVLYIKNVADLNTIKVYDMTGRAVMPPITSTSVSLAHLNEGPYIVKVETTGGIETFKIFYRR